MEENLYSFLHSLAMRLITNREALNLEMEKDVVNLRMTLKFKDKENQSWIVEVREGNNE